MLSDTVRVVTSDKPEQLFGTCSAVVQNAGGVVVVVAQYIVRTKIGKTKKWLCELRSKQRTVSNGII